MLRPLLLALTVGLALAGMGPSWTYGQAEAPAGEKDMGGWVAAVYTEEQQERLGVNELGEKKEPTVAAAAVKATPGWQPPVTASEVLVGQGGKRPCAGVCKMPCCPVKKGFSCDKNGCCPPVTPVCCPENTCCPKGHKCLPGGSCTAVADADATPGLA